MYPNKGGNTYGQQSYAAHQTYGQASIMGSSQEADIGGYRAYASQASQYGGQYALLYGSSTLSNAQQILELLPFILIVG